MVLMLISIYLHNADYSATFYSYLSPHPPALKPMSRALFIEEPLRNLSEGFQTFTPPLQLPPVSLDRFAGERGTAGGLRSRLRRGSRAPGRLPTGAVGGLGAGRGIPSASFLCSPPALRQPGPELGSGS